MEKTVKTVWYQEPFVWLVILFPTLAVVGGMITIYIAMNFRDNLVEEDYYEQGLAINQVLQQDKAANHHHVQATLHFNPEQKILNVYLKTQAGSPLPEHLLVNFSHSIHEELDQQVVLPRIADDTYQGSLSELTAGLWHIQVSADDWRLIKSLTLPLEQVTLVPIESH